MLDKALTAYNAGDAKVFYTDFAKMMAAIATEQAYNMKFRAST